MPDLSPMLAAIISLGVFGAGIVRGATGFGFSMLMIVLLTFFFEPVVIAPVILFWEILASIGHLPFVWREVQWRPLAWMALGVILGTPLGVYCLVSLPVDLMCLAINTVVLVSTLLLFVGFAPRRAPTRLETAGIGLVCGLINGASANGGPPVILFFVSSPAGAAAGRASLIAFFLFTDITASFFCWQQGILTSWQITMALLFSVPMFAGMFLGSRWFRKADATRFRKCTMLLLMLVAVAGILNAL